MDRDTWMISYERWVAAPFPPGTLDDELDELRSDLAYADAMVMDAVVPYAKGRSLGPIPDEAFAALVLVRSRTRDYDAAGDDEKSRTAANIHEYAKLLSAVVDQLPR